MKKEEVIYKLYFKYTYISEEKEYEYSMSFYSLEEIPNKENIKNYIEKKFHNISFIEVIKLIKETLVEEEIEY